MKTLSIGFIGGGRITRIFLEAFKRKAFDPGIIVYDPNPDALSGLARRFPGIDAVNSDPGRIAGCDVVLLAVHPPVLMQVLERIRPSLDPNAMVVSLAPKVTLAAMSAALHPAQPLARANPSAPGIVGRGVHPVAFGASVDNEHRELAFSVLRPLGAVPVVDESKLEAYAIISAMGPTYFWFQFDHLEKLAVRFGLELPEAKDVISEMVQGATAAFFCSGLTPGEVADLVPVHPLSECEATIKDLYTGKLTPLFERIRP